MTNGDLSELIRPMYRDGLRWQDIASDLGITIERARMIARRCDWYQEAMEHRKKIATQRKVESDELEEYDYKTTSSDGSIASEIKKKMHERKTFTKRELLELHALDPDEFEISNIISNEWSMTNSAGEQHWNYQSKISAKPKSDDITVFEQIEQAIQKYVTPFDISNTEFETIDENLTIPFYDLHFSQSNTAYDYQTYQERIMQYLENDYNEVVIILGGDLLNANDFHSQTIHQTRVEDTDMTSAWEEATLFLCPIIEKALATSPNVRVVYLRGNHDESMSWSFVKYLEARYPQCEYDDSVKQLKATLVDDVVFFSTHGHIRKNLKDLVALCSAVYPQEWAKAKRRFLLTGHKHFDKQEDLPGITCIQVTTPSKATVYEEENMYLGTQNGMRLIETSGAEMTALYYL